MSLHAISIQFEARINYSMEIQSEMEEIVDYSR